MSVLKSKSKDGHAVEGGSNWREFLHWDEDGTYTLEQVEDITDIVEANKSQFNSVDERARFSGDPSIGTHVASIPMGIYMKLQREGITSDPKAYAQWLNDYDNRVFRTRPGRV